MHLEAGLSVSIWCRFDSQLQLDNTISPYMILICCIDHCVVTTACRLSPTQMYQSKLYENQNTRSGKRSYGGSLHFHYMTSNSSVEAYGGAKMVHSTITEMLSNVSTQNSSAGSDEYLSVAQIVAGIWNQ